MEIEKGIYAGSEYRVLPSRDAYPLAVQVHGPAE